MKIISIIATLVTASFSITFSQAMSQIANGNSKGRDELIRLDKEWTAAEQRKDMGAVNRIVADEYTDTSTLGRVRDRAQYLAEVGPYEGGGRESDEYDVRAYGQFAVMTHRTTLKNPDYQFRSTHVWLKRDGRWQVISSHYSVIRTEKK